MFHGIDSLRGLQYGVDYVLCMAYHAFNVLSHFG